MYGALLKRLPGKIVVLWTSSVGEMDFTPIEQTYLRILLGDDKINAIWFGDPSLAEVYPEKGFYAPYPFYTEGISPLEVKKEDIATLFCPAGPKKNILNQLLATRIVQRNRKLVLHTNIQGYDEYLKELDCVRHEWLPEVEYRKLVASAKVNLACSWAETFNYQVAEAGLLGTVSVISSTVPLPGLGVENPNDPTEIADSIEEVLGSPYSKGVSDSLRTTLGYRNLEAKKVISDLIRFRLLS